MTWPDSGDLLAPLAAWFDGARRGLPWRAENLDSPHPDPYAVLVSELMLQQTQVATVIPYFERWMARFPDVASLASASPDEVHKAWEGLGYYRRARYLQAAAVALVATGWPRNLAGLKELPGLGPYTAAAVASIAFGLPEAALDGNAFRVLARLLGITVDPAKRAQELRDWLNPALRTLGPSRLTQSLMELGALVCSPSPKCDLCPLAEPCLARRDGTTASIPPRKSPALTTEVDLWLVALHAEGRWLVRPPASGGLLAGLWSWPTLPAGASSVVLAAEAAEPYGMLDWRTWPEWTQVYSHRRERVRPVALEWAHAFPHSRLQWVEEASLESLPMGRRDQKLRSLLATGGQHDEAPPVAGLLNQLHGV